MARAAGFNLEVANPFILGDIILDGDEDSQVIVWENGAPTTWALQFAKWRIYFNVPLPDDIEVEPEETPEEGPGSTSSSSPSPDSTNQKGKKRLAEEAGLEMN